MTEKAYTVVIERSREVEVISTSYKDAKQTVEEMYLSGDACAELEDATYSVRSIRELTEEES